jgi:hypothetical protein
MCWSQDISDGVLNVFSQTEKVLLPLRLGELSSEELRWRRNIFQPY